MTSALQEPVGAIGSRESFQEFSERMREQPIYVILGVQGSGTNLLARLLTRLFSFSVMRDRSSVIQAALRLGRHPSSEDVAREIRRFAGLVNPSDLRRKSSRYVIKKTQFFLGVEAALQRAPIHSGADFAHQIYAYRAFSQGAAYMAIKSDDLWEWVHQIDEVLPNRRIILLTRDFRDNLMSISGKHFGPIEPVCAATYVKQQLAHYVKEYHRAGSAGLHVKFETLVTTTQQFVDAFAARFDVQFPSGHSEAMAALRFRPNKIGKWNALPPRQLAWCEAILEDELREFEYPLVSSVRELPSPHQFLVANARDKVKRVPQKLRHIIKRVKS